MVSLKDRAISISSKYPFNGLGVSATSDESTPIHGDVSECKNHLDQEFMQSLKDNKHLDWILSKRSNT